MDAVTLSPATVIWFRLISVFRHGAFSGLDDATPVTARRKESSDRSAAGTVGRCLNMRSRRDLNTSAKYTAGPSDRCVREPECSFQPQSSRVMTMSGNNGMITSG